MLSKEEIKQFREWSKEKFNIEFRKFEIERANKENPTKPWQLLFALFRDRIGSYR